MTQHENDVQASKTKKSRLVRNLLRRFRRRPRVGSLRKAEIKNLVHRDCVKVEQNWTPQSTNEVFDPSAAVKTEQSKQKLETGFPSLFTKQRTMAEKIKNKAVATETVNQSTGEAAGPSDYDRRVAEALSEFGHDNTEGQKAALFKKWFQARAGQNGLTCIPIKKSGDVRHLFPNGKSDNNDPAYLWALLVVVPAFPEDNCVFTANEACGAKKGEVVYMFESAALASKLLEAYRRTMPLTISAARGKEKIFSKKMNRNVEAWNWADTREFPTKTPSALLLTTVSEASHALPSIDLQLEASSAEERAILSRYAGSVIDTEGTEVVNSPANGAVSASAQA